ncbi:MAG: hypothetical protein P9M14_02375, partial [Candidatus Alcyoniella australis]|nr:hypothetical protein [Candidatus Alcyoniella australis]
MQNKVLTGQQSFEQSWEEFSELISGLGMYVPPAFWEILKVARVIFGASNEVSEALRPSYKALVESTTSRDRDVLTVHVPVLNTHSPEPKYRRIKGVHELHLVNDTDMALLDFDELMIKAQDREL